MPPRKRAAPPADEAQTVPPPMKDDEVAHVNAPPTEPPVTVEEMTPEQTAEAEARWAAQATDREALSAASVAGLLGDIKALKAWAAPADGPTLDDQLNALGRRLDAAEKSWDTVSAYTNDRVSQVELRTDAFISNETAKPAIYAAIWGVMNDVQGVGKHGQMDPASRAGNYRYQRYDDLKRELGAACRTHGVFLQSEILDVVNDRAFDDKRKTRVQIQMRYRFTSLVDGSAVAFESVGESIDTSDKATGKAMTMALKTALVQAFMLAAEDIEDPDATRPGEDDPPSAQAPAPRREPHPTQADLAAAQRALQAGEGPPGVMAAAQHGYPDNRPKDTTDPYDQGPPLDTRTDEQKAQAAADRVMQPNVNMAVWSEVSDAARQMGLYEVLVKVNGQEMALKHHLVAVGRTLG
jgi:hypothetical protein